MKRQAVVAFTFVATLLAYWLWFKDVSFRYLLYGQIPYGSDLNVALQLSRGPWFGLPILSVYDFKSESTGHVYLLTTLLGSFSYFFGAYGLFIASTLLMLLAAISGHRLLIRSGSTVMEQCLAAVLFFGPIVFWIWDDPGHGWHVESLYPPLMILFGCALVERRSSAWLWGGLLALAREDGAIVGLAAHLIVLLTSGKPTRDQLTKTVTIWMVIFSADLFLLRFISELGAQRMAVSLHHLIDLPWDKQLRAVTRQTIFDLLSLSSSAVVPLIILGGARKTLLVFGALLPVVAVNLMGGFGYSTEAIVEYGLGWPPRMAAIWGGLTLSVLLLLARGTRQKQKSGNLSAVLTTLLVIVSEVSFQQFTLLHVRQYNYWSVFARPICQPPAQSPLALLSLDEITLLKCLADRLPPQTILGVSTPFVPFFHRQLAVAPIHFARNEARFSCLICDDQKRFIELKPCTTSAVAFATPAGFPRQVDNISVACTSADAEIATSCLASR